MEKLTKETFKQTVENGKTYTCILWLIPTHAESIITYDEMLELEKKFPVFSEKQNPPVPMNYYYINVDESPELVMSQSVRTVPSIMIYNPAGMVVDILNHKKVIRGT